MRAPCIILALTLAVMGCSEALPELPAGPGPTDAISLRPSEIGPLAAETAWTTVARPPTPGGTLQSGTEVETDEGVLRGEADGDLRIFRGIPFAEAPVGEFRFRAPRPVEPWDGTHDALDYGPYCAQQSLGPEFLLGNYAGETSEDCLSLNVWAFDDQRPRPVMVFIFGGAFVVGGSGWPIYEAAKLARATDATIVTINYRLGPLGYLATEALAAENGKDSGGNYGLLDQIEALRWVQRNITAFGGDPNNVTVFGESAGGISICALLGTPSASGLFHKAIIESGTGCHALPLERDPGLLDSPSAFEAGSRIVEEVGCGDAPDEAACLRALPTQALVDAVSVTSVLSGDLHSTLETSPHVDGELISNNRSQRSATVRAMTSRSSSEATPTKASCCLRRPSSRPDLVLREKSKHSSETRC